MFRLADICLTVSWMLHYEVLRYRCEPALTVAVGHVGRLQDVSDVLHGELGLRLHSLPQLARAGLHTQLTGDVQSAVHQHRLTVGWTGQVRSGHWYS